MKDNNWTVKFAILPWVKNTRYFKVNQEELIEKENLVHTLFITFGNDDAPNWPDFKTALSFFIELKDELDLFTNRNSFGIVFFLQIFKNSAQFQIQVKDIQNIEQKYQTFLSNMKDYEFDIYKEENTSLDLYNVSSLY